METGDIEQYDLGHGLVPKINEINKERVLKSLPTIPKSQVNLKSLIIQRDIQEINHV